jgi:hypothetical protein
MRHDVKVLLIMGDLLISYILLKFFINIETNPIHVRGYWFHHSLPSFPFIRLALTTDNVVVPVKSMWVRPINVKSFLGNVRTIQVGWTRGKGCLQQDLKKRIRQDHMYYCYSILISFPFDPLSSFFLNIISRMPLL